MKTFELPTTQTAPKTGLTAMRLLDVGLTCLAFVLLLPLVVTAALAVLIESGRPILFSQIRIGQRGKVFRMYKFRKFGRDCGTDGSPLTLQGDPRLTSVGRILQATKLDELPQLWNVLKGDMSVVGPRPESLAFADCFVNGFERVLEHKPGVIGPNQVLFRDESCLYPRNVAPDRFYREVLFPIKASIDLAYFSQRTILADIVWLARGVLAVLGWIPSHLGEGGLPVSVATKSIVLPSGRSAPPAASQSLATWFRLRSDC